MFNKTKAIAALTGLVGYDQPFNLDYDDVDDTNLGATSLRKVTDHQYCKIEYLLDCQDYKDITVAQFNTLLTRWINNSISNVLDGVFNFDPDFIDRQVLYQYANNKQTTDTLPAGFVGYRVRQSLEKNMAFEITRDILEFSGIGTVNLLLFSSAKRAPIFNQSVAITSTLQEQVLNWKVDNTAEFYKGEYYYGYLTSGMSIAPFKRDYQNSNVKSLLTFMSLENIQVPNVSTEILWDLENIDGADESWGLNPDISVYYDYTDSIIQNGRLFAKAIQLQSQIECLRVIDGSIRSNLNQRLGKEMLGKIMVEIEGAEFESGVKKIGIKQELLSEMNKIRKEMKRIKDGYFATGITVNTLT